MLANPAYVRRAPLVDGIDEFDAEFFGFPPQLARMLDPQHRLFLQCAWHALEDAGCDPAQFDGSIGVYGTSSPSGYLLHNLSSHHDQNASWQRDSTSSSSTCSCRTTRTFWQRGYLISSTSAARASRSKPRARRRWLRSIWPARACSAVNATWRWPAACRCRVPHHVGYWTSPGSMVSAVGHCRPFDVRADGTVFGSGVAMVALKPLQAAIDAGDRIHAVIRGSAINNDGSMKMGYAAPNPAAQADVIAEAHAVSGIDAVDGELCRDARNRHTAW